MKTDRRDADLIAILDEPYRTMVIVAICTGLRVSEVLALRWEHIDFSAGVILVQRGVVSGRIGKVKTEASQDEIPIDPVFAAIAGEAERSAPRARISVPRHWAVLPCRDSSAEDSPAEEWKSAYRSSAGTFRHA